MSKYRIGDQVLVKANNLGWDGEDYLVEIDGCSPVLVREDNIISYSQKTYEDGLDEAWELARSVLDMSVSDLRKIFGGDWSFPKIMDYSPVEVAERIKKWEDEKEIHVGDVVKVKKIDVGDLFKAHITGFDGVVSGVDEEKCYVILKDGSCGLADKEEIIKTERTVDVDSFLAEIGEEG